MCAPGPWGPLGRSGLEFFCQGDKQRRPLETERPGREGRVKPRCTLRVKASVLPSVTTVALEAGVGSMFALKQEGVKRHNEKEKSHLSPLLL